MKLKAVYTVEASFIVSLTLIVVAATIALGYQVFYEAAEYVVRDEVKLKAVEAFRLRELLK